MTDVVAPDALVEAVATPASGSPRREIWRRFRHDPLAMAGLVVLTIIVFAAVFAPLIAHRSPTDVDLDAARQGPSGAHWLGTDSLGRDEFARVLFGARVSLAVGFSTAVAAIALGTLLGSTAGYFGRWVDSLIMRIADLFLSLPAVIVAIVLAGIFGPSVPLLVLIIAGFSWPTSCRVARSRVLSVKGQDYVLAARSYGVRWGRLQQRYLLPAVYPPVSVTGTLLVAEAILTEAALSFLGVGVRPPTPSWGNLLIDGQSLTVLSRQPWLWLPPGIAIALTVLAVNFVGDGLRDAMDPRLAGR